MWLAYLAIPLLLIFFARRRRDVPFHWLFWMFGAFILSCGFSHFMEIVTSYTPLYRLSALVKLGTGLVSWATVVCLVPVVPRALALRSPEELQQEVDERKRVEAELRLAHAELEKRVQQLVAAEGALRQSEAMFQGLFQFAPDAIAVTDPQGMIRLANLQMQKLLGYEREEIVGQRIEVLLTEGCREEYRKHEVQVQVPGAAEALLPIREMNACRKDGREIPVEMVLTPLETPGGAVVLANIRDISHRKANEAIIRERARQAVAMAEFGQRALASSDTDSLLAEAVSVAARTLDADLGCFSQLRPEDNRLTVRAAWGWKSEQISEMLFRRGPDSQTGYCLAIGAPVVVADLRLENRFVPAPYLLQQDARSGVSVRVTGKSGPPGVLDVHTRRLRQFSVHDVAFLQTFANMLAAVIDRTEAERQVQGSLVEKELLLKEVHHRVKNNLQIISSLLDLQSLHTTDPTVVEMFRESRNRVRSMALVHERLYRSGDLARVDFRAYLESLADHLFQTYRLERQEIDLELDADDVGLPIDVAVPCGLLLNELLANCLKHAFVNRDRGVIRISLRQLDGEVVSLGVADDGVGIPEGIDLQHSDSFGLQLVGMLVAQLKGTARLTRNGGTRIDVEFPLSKSRRGR